MDNKGNAAAVLVMPALGRPFTLGMLYDKRTDRLVPGVTLWDDETLQKNIKEKPQPYSEFHVSASDSIESKSRLLDINASLEASLFGGLVKVGGSASYLNDNKEYHSQARVTFQYKATTTFKQLMVMSPQTKRSPRVDSVVKGLATHVVTGILYGANAFFVFDTEKIDSSSVEDIQGQMEAVVKLIPSFNVDGKVNMHLNAQQQETVDTFSCTFYGDVILKSNPTTFDQAVQAYAALPSLVEEENMAVPLQVWLMPLKNLDSQAAEVKNGVSVGVLRLVNQTLEDIKQVKMRCKDCLDDTVVNTFPQIHNRLSTFHRLCDYYTAAVQVLLAKNLPMIRAGEQDESCLKRFLEERDKSPFSHAKVSVWMKDLQREINVIRSTVDMLQGTKVGAGMKAQQTEINETKILSCESELDREVLAADTTQVLCFMFTSLETSDPYLQQMADYVDPLKVLQAEAHYDQRSKAACSEPWYYDSGVISIMRTKAQRFCALEKVPGGKKFIAATAKDDKQGASIYLYKDGALVSNNYS